MIGAPLPTSCVVKVLEQAEHCKGRPPSSSSSLCSVTCSPATPADSPSALTTADDGPLPAWDEAAPPYSANTMYIQARGSVSGRQDMEQLWPDNRHSDSLPSMVASSVND